MGDLGFVDDVAEAVGRLSADRCEVLILPLREVNKEVSPLLERVGELGTKILLLDNDDPEHLALAADVRGDGFRHTQELGTETPGETLRRMRAGEVPMPSKPTKDLLALVREETRANRTSGRTRMTPRERQVLGLMAEGSSNRRIARRLGISEHGVKRLVASILAKPNCSNRTAAVVKALQEGLCAGVPAPAGDGDRRG